MNKPDASHSPGETDASSPDGKPARPSKRGADIDFSAVVAGSSASKAASPEPPPRSDETISGVLAIARAMSVSDKVVAIDPKTVALPKFFDRMSVAYADSDPDFTVLKDSISANAGNTVPIKVRPIGSTEDAPAGAKYWLVYGSRRLRACMVLGLKVNAAVQADLTDRQAFSQMVSENTGHAALSSIERGRSYKSALEMQLAPSVRALASLAGVDHAFVLRAVKLASLPQDIIDAYPDPREMSASMAPALEEAWTANATGVAQKAQEIKKLDQPLPAAAITRALIAAGATAADGHSDAAGEGSKQDSQPVVSAMAVEGFDKGCVIKTTKTGRIVISLTKGSLTAEQLRQLAAGGLRSLFKPSGRSSQKK